MGDWFEPDTGAGSSTGNQGYNYTYLYPGIQKVVQAAGRVIRTQLDEGVIYLMDDRFTQPEVQALLPAWWKVGRLHAPAPSPQMAPVRLQRPDATTLPE